MKNMITAIACVLLLMAFLVQFVQNQVLFQKLVLANAAVEQWDGVSEGLEREISEIMSCSEGAVAIRQEDDEIEVRFPITSVLASPEFWGIDEAENTVSYVIRREKLPGKENRDE